MPTISSDLIVSALAEARKEIGEADSVWLLSFLLNKNRLELFLDGQQIIPKALRKKYQAMVVRRKKGEPLQYIAGSAAFYGREFKVDPRVLIPRPETEQLVELALKEGDAFFSKASQAGHVIDIGAGSGAIAVTLKCERPHWEISGSDISLKALALARFNAKKFAAKIQWKAGDLWAPWVKNNKRSMVVANLPYVDAKKEFVEAQVRDWEPHLALFPKRWKKSRMKDEASHVAERLLEEIFAGKSPVGLVLLELSAKVAYNIERRFRGHPAVEKIERRCDLSKRHRFLLIRIKEIRE